MKRHKLDLPFGLQVGVMAFGNRNASNEMTDASIELPHTLVSMEDLTQTMTHIDYDSILFSSCFQRLAAYLDQVAVAYTFNV